MNCLKSNHTGNMPWDDIFDYTYYKVSRPRMIKYKVKLVKEKQYVNKIYRSYTRCAGHTQAS